MSPTSPIEQREPRSASRPLPPTPASRRFPVTAALAVTDALILSTAVLLLSFLHRASLGSPASVAGIRLAMGFVGLSLACLAAVKAYETPARDTFGRQAGRLTGALSFAAMLYAMATAILTSWDYTAGEAAFLWATCVACLLAARAIAQLLLRTPVRKLIIVATADTAAATVERLRKRDPKRQLAGLVSVDAGHSTPDGLGIPFLGNLTILPKIIAAQGPCDVLVCVPPGRYASVQEQLRLPVSSTATIELALSPFFDGMGVTDLGKLGGIPVVRLRPSTFPWQYEVLKRFMDIVGALSALLLAGPVMVAIALAIKMESAGPVFYRQTRVGRNGRLFQMLKFRSMYQGADAMLADLKDLNEASGPMFKLRQDPRVTKVGAVIRRHSLDEIPQLFNVLAGTMSLVGPRPPLPWEVKEYQPWHMRRLAAIPGLTGMWQVNRGDDPSFDEMVQMDLSYIEDWSLALDIAIMFKTVPVVLLSKGAY